MADTLTLVGLMLNFAGALLLVLHRFPAPEERSRNLRRYWRNAVATRAGLLCLCVGFAFQLLGFIYPDYGPGETNTTMTLHQVRLAARHGHGG
jgi:hypothetical protein